MPSEEVEMSDVVVMLDEYQPGQIDGLVASLKLAGLDVDEVDADNGVVEGSIITCKIRDLEKMPGVKYVRSVFNYRAEPPQSPGGRDDFLEEEADDAR